MILTKTTPFTPEEITQLSQEFKTYIQTIVTEIKHTPNGSFSQAQAEQLLMYSVLLQNYSLHLS